MDLLSYTALVHAYVKANQVERAWDAIVEMREAGIQPDIVRHIY